MLQGVTTTTTTTTTATLLLLLALLFQILSALNFLDIILKFLHCLHISNY
jgi:hypothetical protein